MGIIFRKLKWFLVKSSLISWEPGMNLKANFAISPMVYSHAGLSYLGYVFHILSVWTIRLLLWETLLALCRFITSFPLWRNICSLPTGFPQVGEGRVLVCLTFAGWVCLSTWKQVERNPRESSDLGWLKRKPVGSRYILPKGLVDPNTANFTWGSETHLEAKKNLTSHENMLNRQLVSLPLDIRL